MTGQSVAQVYWHTGTETRGRARSRSSDIGAPCDQGGQAKMTSRARARAMRSGWSSSVSILPKLRTGKRSSVSSYSARRVRGDLVIGAVVALLIKRGIGERFARLAWNRARLVASLAPLCNEDPRGDEAAGNRRGDDECCRWSSSLLGELLAISKVGAKWQNSFARR